MSTTSKKTGEVHSRIRKDHASELAEDYVEAVLDFIENDGICRAVDLARKFDVSHVTVNRTLKRLSRDGYVIIEPYSPIELTAKGKKTAKEARKRHQIVFEFLKSLGVSEKNAAVDSEGIEHHVSQETLTAMAKHLKSGGRKKA